MQTTKEDFLERQLNMKEIFVIENGQAFEGAGFPHLHSVRQGNLVPWKAWSFSIIKISLNQWRAEVSGYPGPAP